MTNHCHQLTWLDLKVKTGREEGGRGRRRREEEGGGGGRKREEEEGGRGRRRRDEGGEGRGTRDEYPIKHKNLQTISYSERVAFAGPSVSHVKLPPTTLTASLSPEKR